MMANISFHSNSPVVAATGGPKLLPTKLANHHFLHHSLFGTDSSSPTPSSSTASVQQQSSITTSNNGTMKQKIIGGVAANASASSVGITTASIVANTTTGRIITTVPGSVVRAISLSDASKLLANKRINCSTGGSTSATTLTPISLNTNGNVHHHNVNGSGAGVITLSHIKAATAAAAAATNSGSSTTTPSNGNSGSTTTSTATTNNVLIYNIKADANDPNSKSSTVLLTNDATLLTNSILNGNGSLKFITATGATANVATSGSSDPSSADSSTKSAPIIIYPKFTNANAITSGNSTIINASSMLNGAHVLKSVSTGSNGSVVNPAGATFIKKIKVELAQTASQAPNVTTPSSKTTMTATTMPIIKEEITTQTTPLVASNKVVKLKSTPTNVDASQKLVHLNGTLDSKQMIITLPTKVIDNTSAKVMLNNTIVSKSNIENCLPNNSSLTLMNNGATPVSNANNNANSASNVQRLSLNASSLTSTIKHNKYLSLSNISPYLPDEIFDTDEEDLFDEEEEVDLKKDLLNGTANVPTTPLATNSLQSNNNSSSNSNDHSMYAKMNGIDVTMVKQEIIDAVEQIEVGKSSFDSSSLVVVKAEVMEEEKPKSVSLPQAKTESKVTGTNSALRINGSSSAGVRKTKLINSGGLAVSHQKGATRLNFTTVVTPKASGGTKFAVLKHSAGAPKLITTAALSSNGKLTVSNPGPILINSGSKIGGKSKVEPVQQSKEARRNAVWTTLLKELMPRKEKMTAARKDMMDKRKFLATNCEIAVMSRNMSRAGGASEYVMPAPVPKVVMIRKRPASSRKSSSSSSSSSVKIQKVSGNSSASSLGKISQTPSVTSSGISAPSLARPTTISSTNSATTTPAAQPRTITLHLTPDQLSNLGTTFLVARPTGASGSTGGTILTSNSSSGTLKLNSSNSCATAKTITIASPAILSKSAVNSRNRNSNAGSMASANARRTSSTQSPRVQQVVL